MSKRFGYRREPDPTNIPIQILDIIKNLKESTQDHVRDTYRLRLMDIKDFIENALEDTDKDGSFKRSGR